MKKLFLILIGVLFVIPTFVSSMEKKEILLSSSQVIYPNEFEKMMKKKRTRERLQKLVDFFARLSVLGCAGRDIYELVDVPVDPKKLTRKEPYVKTYWELKRREK